MKKLILIFFLTFSLNGMAQEKQKIEASDYTNSDVEMADALREDGKIYVLTGIILIILAGTITYLVTIDRKVSRLEKQSKS
ncbi:CcmD family protein [Fulvivirga lutimaris]|uniref:CcmD family protein n=1 Tax=Fulvivirga lutimaris TaxID=1819566 RepID=UPI0012BBC24C|nr:CcmD family protein [Fulvivirga lutimaris]MTI38578.1 CcmD family protein [Fulvivirga lutimaris]